MFDFSNHLVRAMAALSLVSAVSCTSLGKPESLPTREGVTQPLFTIQAKNPVASVVLLAGGTGDLNLLTDNFLVRSRQVFVQEGFNVALVDVPSDRFNLRNFRTSAAHAEDLGGVIAFMRRSAGLPVWLVGTSNGTISAVNAAARLTAGGPDGIVLTSSVFRPWNEKNPETIHGAGLDRVRVPTLFVHHRGDECRITKIADLERALEALAHARQKDKLIFEGGDAPISHPCRALSQHGFLGIERKVVQAIGAWIRSR